MSDQFAGPSSHAEPDNEGLEGEARFAEVATLVDACDSEGSTSESDWAFEPERENAWPPFPKTPEAINVDYACPPPRESFFEEHNLGTCPPGYDKSEPIERGSLKEWVYIVLGNSVNRGIVCAHHSPMWRALAESMRLPLDGKSFGFASQNMMEDGERTRYCPPIEDYLRPQSEDWRPPAGFIVPPGLCLPPWHYTRKEKMRQEGARERDGGSGDQEIWTPCDRVEFREVLRLAGEPACISGGSSIATNLSCWGTSETSPETGPTSEASGGLGETSPDEGTEIAVELSSLASDVGQLNISEFSENEPFDSPRSGRGPGERLQDNCSESIMYERAYCSSSSSALQWSHHRPAAYLNSNNRNMGMVHRHERNEKRSKEREDRSWAFGGSDESNQPRDREPTLSAPNREREPDGGGGGNGWVEDRWETSEQSREIEANLRRRRSPSKRGPTDHKKSHWY